MALRLDAGGSASLLATLALVARYGLSLEPVTRARVDLVCVVLAAVVVLGLAVELARARLRPARLAGRLPDVILTALLGAGLAGLTLGLPPAAGMHLVHGYLLGTVLLRLLRVHERVLALHLQPVALLVGSFAVLVTAGTLLLALPRASADAANPLSWLDALFLATSASSVTGLVVRDVGRALSPFGQGVLLALIQLGGLGIITFVATLGVLTGRALSIPQLVALRELTSTRGLADVRRQVLVIALGTAAVELGGAAVLYALWPEPTTPTAHRLFQSVFHAVSAFCNAGFTLTADSLISVADRPGIVVTMTTLLIAGGLGFPVYRNLRHAAFRSGSGGRVHVHTRLALITTAVLLLGGTLAYLSLEVDATLRGADLPQLGARALFEAATARTAGFTTTPTAELRAPTTVLLMILMVIGAGPVSTGGGIKTVTFAVLLLAVRAMLGGRDRVEIFGRTLPQRLIYTALSVFVLYVLGAVTVTLLLAVCDPGLPLHRLSFEAVSALSTVGLSAGITPLLSTPGRLVVCVAMFVGRVGPLALAMTVFGARRGSARYDYPEEEVVVG